MEIKVLGTGCAKCKTTYQTIEKVISENNLEDVKLTKVEDIVEILNSGIMATPAVVVDGAVKVCRIHDGSANSSFSRGAMDDAGGERLSGILEAFEQSCWIL